MSTLESVARSVDGSVGFVVVSGKRVDVRVLLGSVVVVSGKRVDVRVLLGSVDGSGKRVDIRVLLGCVVDVEGVVGEEEVVGVLVVVGNVDDTVVLGLVTVTVDVVGIVDVIGPTVVVSSTRAFFFLKDKRRKSTIRINKHFHNSRTVELVIIVFLCLPSTS